MSNAAQNHHDWPTGTGSLPSDLTDDDLDAAPALASADVLLIDGLTDDEDNAFADALHA